MRDLNAKNVSRLILLFGLLVAGLASAQAQRTTREPSLPIVSPTVVQTDTAAVSRIATAAEATRNVDSLHYIILYNAEMLKDNLDRNLIWIYTMLGAVIVGTVLIYRTLVLAQRARKELEERIYRQVSATVSQLEDQIKSVEPGLKSKRSPPKRGARKAKKPR